VQAAAVFRISNEIIECQADAGIIGRDNRTGARAHDHIDRNVVRDEPL
jgi:hypothetical protein